MPFSKDRSPFVNAETKSQSLASQRQYQTDAGITELLLGEQLSEVIPGYRSRISQLEMALDIELALKTRSHLIVESGAGSGKTLAYLLPVLMTGGRTLIATSTHTLQQQVQDIAVSLGKIVGHRSVVVIKGRRNYVCPRRLLNPEVAAEVSEKTMLRLQQLQAWWPRSETGDLTEFMDIDVDDDLQEIVTCPAESCAGSSCPMIDLCPLDRIRRRVHDAEIVIGNHHLLAGMLRSDPLDVLSGFDHIVVDEAHRLPDVIARCETISLSSDQLRYLIAAVVREAGRSEVDSSRLLDAAASLEDVVVATADDSSSPVLQRLAERLQRLEACVSEAAQQSFKFRNLLQRIGLLRVTLGRLLADVDTGSTHQDESRRTGFHILGLHEPVSRSIQRMVIGSEATWVFTSATLAVNGTCHQFQEATGMQDVRATLFPSEYDYPNQASLWIPDISQPSESAHIPELVRAVLPLLGTAPTLMLFCSKKAMDEAAALLAGFDGLLVQGRMSRQGLVEAFSAMEKPVLLATQSFREGIELAGDRLRLLVVDKLPFPNIGDIDVQIRMTAVTLSSRDSFRDYILPEAVIALRQSFGRLIRREHQRGLFVLGDPRIRTHDYGAQFLHSLPSMPVLTSDDEAMTYFQDIVNEPASA